MLVHITELPASDVQAIAEAFAEEYRTEKDPGMFASFPDPDSLSAYLSAYVRAGLRCGWMYQSGPVFVMLHRDEEYPGAGAMMILRIGLLKALGARKAHAFLSLLQASGPSLEQQLRSRGCHFLQAELIAIPVPLQHQHHLRAAMADLCALADRLGVALILSTDQQLKMEKYRHLGMRLIQTRRLSERQRIYEMMHGQER